MTNATVNLEGLTSEELVSDRVRCLKCGAYKDETSGKWLIDSGIIACPDCRGEFDE